METIVVLLGFFSWSVFCFLGGVVFSAHRTAAAFVKCFDKEKLRAAYIGDDNDLKKTLEGKI